MKDVLYLTYATLQMEDGFIFPNEIEDENYYSPGIFIVEGKSYYKTEEKYNFKAFYGQSVKSYSLVKIRKNIYRVRIENDTDIYFRIKFVASAYNKYLGKKKNRFIDDNFFYEVIPMQPNQLENLCKSENFFFVGSTE